MNVVTDIVEVYDLLYRLGFSATNTAFFHLSGSFKISGIDGVLVGGASLNAQTFSAIVRSF